MSIALSELVLKLSEYVQAVNSRPTNTQYEDAVKTAVVAFNNKLGQIDRATISVVANTASYDLPDDFLKFIKVDSIGVGDVVSQPGGLLLPLDSISQPESAVVRGRTITFYPTPTYTADRYIWYKAGHVLTGGTTYTYMTEDVMYVVLVKAKAEVLRLLSTDTPAAGFKYSVGDFMVDKSGVGKSFGEVISKFDSEFDKLVADMRGPVGMRQTYNAAEQAIFGV